MTTATLTKSNKETALQELQWRKVQKDFGFFVDEFCWMWVKEGGDPVRFKLWPFQRDAADKMQHKKMLIVLKARQMGLSWLASAYVLWKVMTKQNFHAYYTSIGLKEVQEQRERIRFIFANLPQWMQMKAQLGGRGCKDNDKLMEFTNKTLEQLQLVLQVSDALLVFLDARAVLQGDVFGQQLLIALAQLEQSPETSLTIVTADSGRASASFIHSSIFWEKEDIWVP